MDVQLKSDIIDLLRITYEYNTNIVQLMQIPQVAEGFPEANWRATTESAVALNRQIEWVLYRLANAELQAVVKAENLGQRAEEKS